MSVIRKSSLTALVLLLAASAAQAVTYTVTMSNGTSFETRYRPMTAEWDTNYAMLRTDQGNWIALKKSEIVDVVSSTELSGFGYQMDETTIFLGWSASEGLAADEATAAAQAGGDAANGAAGTPAGAMPAAGADSGIGGAGYTMEQFVTVPSSGVIPGGIPLGTGSSSGGTVTGSNRPGS